jgi:hypothetical protein
LLIFNDILINIIYLIIISYALLPILYSEDFEVKATMMEVIAGLGLLGGFMMGSLLYSVGGYYLPFFLNAGILIGVGLFLLKYIPNNKEISEYVLQNKE